MGVTEEILLEESTVQQVKARVPLNGAPAKFIHLIVVTPP